MKRFIAQSQGDIRRVWNVLDTKASIFIRFGITGNHAKREALALAKRLNQDKRRSK